MKKKGLIICLSLLGFALPLVNKQNYSSAYAEEEPELPTYTTEREGLYEKRVYSDFYLGNITASFKAPCGSIFHAESNEDNLKLLCEKIVPTLPGFEDLTTFAMVDVVVNRIIGESCIYSDSDCDWEVNLTDLESYINSKMNNLLLYEVEEKTTTFIVSAKVTIELYSHGDEVYYLEFPLKPIEVTPFENGDILHLNYMIFAMEEENRITVSTNYDEGLFDPVNGFTTDELEYDWVTETYSLPKYQIDIIQKDTNVILQSNGNAMEISPIPKQAVTVFARMRFVSGGKQYEFLSNDLVLEEKIAEINLDGYNNRNTIGINEPHTLDFVTKIDYKSIYQVDVSLGYMDDDYYPLCNHYYIDSEETSEDLEYKEVNDDFWKFDFTLPKVGEFRIYASINIMCKDKNGNASDIIYSTNHLYKDIKVVRTGPKYTALDEALTLNVPSRINCLAGGDFISIEANFASDLLNNNETPAYEWKLSRINVVNIETNGNKVRVDPVSGGVVTLFVTCHTQNNEDITKSVTIDVIEEIYSISHIVIEDSQYTCNDTVTVNLEIEHYDSVVNFKPKWQVLNKQNEVVNFVNNGNLSIKLDKPSQDDYTFICSYNDVEIDREIVQVRERFYNPTEEDISFNVPSRIDVVAGGDEIDVKALIADYLKIDGEEATYEWSLSRVNVIDIEPNGDTVKVNPIGGGVAILSVNVYGSNFSNVSKSVVVNVINDIYAISKLSVPDEFHYSGEDLTVKVDVDKYSNVLNFKPEWQVFDKEDNPVEFVDNGDASITIKEAKQNDYRIVCSYKGVEIDTQVVQVRDVNVDLFIKQNIWWMLLVVIAFMIIVILLKSTLEKKRSLVERIQKTNDKFDEIKKEDKSTISDLNKVRSMLQRNIEYARDLNMDSFNQYEKTIRYLNKSIEDIKVLKNAGETMSTEEYEEAYNKLTKDIRKSLAVASEIEEARDLSLANSYKANQNNITLLQEESKKKKKKQ